MLRRLCSAGVWLFLAIWLVLLIVGRTSLFRDPGTFWHVVVGRQILDTGHVPQADTLSFTRAGHAWTAHQWLAEAAMAVVHRIGGWDSLLLVTVTLLAAVYAWVGSRLMRCGLAAVPAVLVLALVLLTSTHNFHVRPMVVTIALGAWTFGLLTDVEAGRTRAGHLAWLVPVFVLWANLHGGVLGGIGTVGLVVAGWCLLAMAGRPSPARSLRSAITLVALVAACGLTVLASPYGLGLPRAWMATMGLPLPELIQEHARLNLTETFGWTAVLLAAGYVAVLAGTWGRCPRVTWLVPLVWFVLAAERIRNLPLFAVAAALALADVLPHSRVSGWLAGRDLFRPGAEDKASGARRAGVPHAAILPAALVALALLLQVAGVRVPVVGRDWVQLNPARWPVELLPELQQINDTAPEGTPIFNDLDLGGFVIYHAPRLRVFIDDRCALYGGEFLRAYDHARLKDPAQVDRWQQQYHFPYALVLTGTEFDRYLEESADWVMVDRAPAGTLYRRK